MALLSESQILRVLGDPPLDAYAVLSRQVNQPLSDTTVVGILLAKSDSGPRELPLPVASRFTRLTRPLNYRRGGQSAERQDNPMARVPIAYRVARVVLWLGVAAELVAVIISSIRLG